MFFKEYHRQLFKFPRETRTKVRMFAFTDSNIDIANSQNEKAKKSNYYTNNDKPLSPNTKVINV